MVNSYIKSLHEKEHRPGDLFISLDGEVIIKTIGEYVTLVQGTEGTPIGTIYTELLSNSWTPFYGELVLDSRS